MVVGVLAAAFAASSQAQNSGLTAAGSNFSGPGGGGGGATGSVGAFLPAGANGTIAWGNMSTGMPRYGAGGSFATATGPTNVTIGSGANSITVSVSAAAQRSAAGAVTGSGVASFVSSLTGVSGAAAQALGDALSSLGAAFRGGVGYKGQAMGGTGTISTAVSNAIAAFNAAVNSLPAGSPVPESLVAARVLISGYYIK